MRLVIERLRRMHVTFAFDCVQVSCGSLTLSLFISALYYLLLFVVNFLAPLLFTNWLAKDGTLCRRLNLQYVVPVLLSQRNRGLALGNKHTLTATEGLSVTNKHVLRHSEARVSCRVGTCSSESISICDRYVTAAQAMSSCVQTGRLHLVLTVDCAHHTRHRLENSRSETVANFTMTLYVRHPFDLILKVDDLPFTQKTLALYQVVILTWHSWLKVTKHCLV